MFTFFLFIKKCLTFLNSNESIENISFSLTMAFIFSLIPFNILVHPLLLIGLVLFNGNLLIFLFITPILSLLTPHMHQEIHLIGDFILTFQKAQPVYYKIANWPIVNFTNWNNTVSMGAYTSSIIAALPLYFFYWSLLKLYRRFLLSKIKKVIV